ncbi:MAG: hypothetical protein JNJ54_14800 [Myxococcaceae bacterium]|nr:hypothetical protein [Myxococcaceae bacterium]
MSSTSRATTLYRWMPVLLAALPVLLCLASGLVRRAFPPPPPEPFPRLLIPGGAAFLSKDAGESEHCYAHTVARVGPVSSDAAASWAKRLDLPCDADVDGGAPCPAWSTAHRKDRSWGHEQDEPDGLDTVQARLDGTTLVVDWGDYLCAGPL